MTPKSKSAANRILSRCLRFVELVSFWGVVASAAASLLHADQFRLGMLLTYSPRIFWLAIATVLLLRYATSKRCLRSLLIFASALLLIWDTPVGLGRAVDADEKESAALMLLSFNTGAKADHAGSLRELSSRKGIDILCLQEVTPSQRDVYANKFPNFRFFHGDESANFEHAQRRVFSSLIGVKADLLSRGSDVEVFTGITGYRTFAIKAKMNDDRFLRIANVHTTKPFTIYYGLGKIFSNAAHKAARHRDEKKQLGEWLAKDAQTPTIIAGDFNAPANSENLRFAGMSHSHRQAGTGLHLTYPRSFPFIGIDHILGNDKIVFTSSETVDARYSDHRAQVATFQIDPDYSRGVGVRIRSDSDPRLRQR